MKRKQSKGKDKRSIIYIAQPTFNEGNLNMQKSFVIKPENKLESVAEEKEISTKEEVDVIAEAEVFEEVKEEAEIIEEVKEEAEIAEAEVIEEVKEQVEFTKEKQTDGEQLKDEQPETRVMAAKENKLFSNPIVAEKKNEEAGLSKGVQKRKSFKDMNNEEKLYFLIHKPKYIPKVRCQIKTVKENLTGYVLSYEEGYVAIKMMEKTKEIKVKFEDIVHIKMMGL
ncbi:CotO family spore coat protein [Bacillus pseudomycoides]|uniref:CotO family spore coat protein n=1 Tax=Bacillus pseudomycoides TaxID=64104 RepID=UPI003CFBB036